MRVLKDAEGKVFGKVNERASDHVLEARDASGKLLAHYNPKSNETRNDRGDLVGHGNRLEAVLRGRRG